MVKSAISKYAYYVHYHASNFIRQQRLPESNALSNYAIHRVRSLSGQLKSGISSKVKQEYANTISALYGRDIKDGVKLNTADINGIQQILEEFLEEQVTQFTKADKIEWLSGRVINGKPQGDQTVTRGDKNKVKRYLTADQVSRLNQLINVLSQEIGLTPKEEKLKALQRTLLELISYIDKIETEQFNKMKTIGEYDKRLLNLRGVDKNIKRYDFGKQGVQLINDLNNHIALCKMQDMILTTAQGTLGEDIAAVAADVMSGLAIEKITETISNSVVGGKNVNIEWKIKGIPAEAYADFLLNDKKYQKGQTIISKWGSQQKVDVVVNLPVEQKISEFKKVNISMKSVDLVRDIHLVSGTNLWYLIQDESAKSFLRPYLNITADHYDALQNPDSPKKIATIENLAIKQVDALRKDAFLAARILIAYKALSGQTYGRTAAQLFVINDIGAKKVYVLEINDIIKAILKQVQKNASSINDYFTYNLEDNDLILKNVWSEESLHKRMSQLIQDARMKKLFIAMKNTTITSNLLSNNKIIG